MATATLTRTVTARTPATVTKLATKLAGDGAGPELVEAVTEAVLQFRLEVGRDPLDMDELQAFSDGESIDVTPLEVLTVASLREMLLVRGLKGAARMTKADICEYLRTGDRPGKPKAAPKADTVEAMRARCKRLGLTGYSAMGGPELREWLHTVDTYGLAEAMTRKPAKAAPKAGTVAALRAELKAQHPTVKGLSGANKSRLTALQETGILPPPAERTRDGKLTGDGCKKLLSAARASGKDVPAYSKLRVDSLRALVAKLGLA
jgi:hypothetical protein